MLIHEIPANFYIAILFLICSTLGLQYSMFSVNLNLFFIILFLAIKHLGSINITNVVIGALFHDLLNGGSLGAHTFSIILSAIILEKNSKMLCGGLSFGAEILVFCSVLLFNDFVVNALHLISGIDAPSVWVILKYNLPTMVAFSMTYVWKDVLGVSLYPGNKANSGLSTET